MATMYVFNIPTNQTVNLREKASSTAKVLIAVPYGKEVEASPSSTSGWHNCSYWKDGLYTGYMMSQYLTATNPSGGSSGGTATPGVINGTNVNVRPDPSTSHAAKAVVNTGDKVTYYDGENITGSGYSWYRCTSTKWSGTGYIVKTYVKPDFSPLAGVVGSGPNSKVSADMIRAGNGLWKQDTATTYHPQIYALQQRLKTACWEWEYDLGPMIPDGCFGPTTNNYVRRYQLYSLNPKLSVDGLVGQSTLLHIEAGYGKIT